MKPHEDVTLPPMDENNAVWVANVHPPGWVNPVPQPRYNLVVIGAGTAGLVTAAGAAGLGAKVALVERHLMGGDCLNVGCVPSKTIIRSGRALADVHDAPRFGISVPGEASVDFRAVMERMRAVRAGISQHDSVTRFRDLGVDVYLGTARFSGSDTVDVDGQALRFRKAVIATGCRPLIPPIPGLLDVEYLTNETVFSMTSRPKRLAILGGGPIGCELSQAFQRLGSQVTLINKVDRLLPRDDPDAVRVLTGALQRDGVKLLLGAEVTRVEVVNGSPRVIVKSGGAEEAIDVDTILIAAGRAPNVEGLDLESAGVDYDEKGVRVDNTLRTTNPRVYAAGDVCMKHKFTHAADASARIVIQNALFGFAGKKKASALTIPWCTYTDPEIAQIGLTEMAAAEQGLSVHTVYVPMADVDRARTDSESEGFLKVTLRSGSDRIVGATLVARHAGELIGAISLAMEAGIGLRRMANVIHPYPTQSEIVRKAADAYNRTRLTPMVRRVLETLLKWQR